MDCKQENLLTAKIVGHIVNEKDLAKPEFAGLSVGTPIVVAFTSNGDQIHAARLDMFKLHIVQDGENIKNQKPGTIVVALENNEYATLDEINASMAEELKDALQQSDKIMKLDDEALNSVVGGKIVFSWKNLIRFAVATVVTIGTGGLGAVVTVAADIGVAAATSLATASTGIARKDYSKQRLDDSVQPYIDLLPFDIKR